MNDESIEHIELQISAASQIGAPIELRMAVLANVQRELRAAKWDRRLVRAAAVLLVVGVGLNVGIVLKPAVERGVSSQVAESNARQSLVDTAVVVAEATDAKTGSEYARQMAAMMGHKLTADDVAAIDAAVGAELRNNRERKKG